MIDQMSYQLQSANTYGVSEVTETELLEQLNEYLAAYLPCFSRPSQFDYFSAFEKGLLSDSNRKSIDAIALAILGEKSVRGLQQFFTRSKGFEEPLFSTYQNLLADTLSAPDGFLSVDGSDFVKKGTHSERVSRQYCGRLGKTENCQAGVFLSYGSENGYGLVDKRLYLPENWFSDNYAEKRNQCTIPTTAYFQTKIELALDMIHYVIEQNLFDIQWIGCDRAFGCDHAFLRSLPKEVCYFAGVREKELVFLERPTMRVPKNKNVAGRPFKHPRPDSAPVKVKAIAHNDIDYPWTRRQMTEGAKGPIYAQVKYLRAVACHSTTLYGNYMMPEETEQSTLDKLTTRRWAIEPCFQECKSQLGMADYETRTFPAWHRHMMCVMIVHLFTTRLRLHYKKILFYDAHD